MRTARLCDVALVNPVSPEFEKLDHDDPVAFLPMENVWPDDLRFEERPKSQVEVGYTRFQPGDVLVPKIAPTFGHGRSAVAAGFPTSAGAGTTELHVLRPKPGVDPRWLFYLTKAAPFLQEGDATQYGVAGQKRISFDWFRTFRVPALPLAEQRRVVEYLDTETARIDRLVAEQVRLMDLAREHADAAVDQEVWLGNPKTIRIGYLTPADRPITYGIVLPGPNVESGVLLVKGGDVKPGRLHPDRLNRTTAEIEAPYARARLRPRDIVYSIRGSIGDAEMVPPELDGANMTQDVARIAVDANTDPNWLLFAVRSRRFFAQMEAESRGATIRGINIWSLKRGVVPRVNLSEQRRVARRCQALATELARLNSEISLQVRLLNEHRQALITAAVTGGLQAAGRVA